MANTSLASQLASARQMQTALAANSAAVSSRGADAAFVTAGQDKIESLQALDSEQEALKAALKLKTAALDAAVAELKAWQSEAAGMVKLAYRNEQEKWVEFGLAAKR